MKNRILPILVLAGITVWLVCSLMDSKQEVKPSVDGQQVVSKAANEGSIPSSAAIGESSNGRTADFDSASGGSNPSSPAILEQEALILEYQVSESLHGVINVNDWCDTIAEFVQFPLNPQPIEDWRDESVDCYEFLTGDDNAKAYLEVEKEDGSTAIRVESSSNKNVGGILRRANEIILRFGEPSSSGDLPAHSLQSYCKVALGENRRAGIEVYRGEFREGIIYQNGQAFQYGIKDARPTKLEGQCTGDLTLDLERVRLLNERVTMLLQEIQK